MSVSEKITCTRANSLSTPGLCVLKNLILLYSLMKSAASAVLKLISAVFAVAHVLSVSTNSLSVTTMLF